MACITLLSQLPHLHKINNVIASQHMSKKKKRPGGGGAEQVSDFSRIGSKCYLLHTDRGMTLAITVPSIPHIF